MSFIYAVISKMYPLIPTLIIIVLALLAFDYVVNRTFLKKSPIIKNILYLILIIGLFYMSINYIEPITISVISKIFAS